VNFIEAGEKDSTNNTQQTRLKYSAPVSEKNIFQSSKHLGIPGRLIVFSFCMERIYDLEERLINFTCRMIDVIEALPKTRSATYMANQLVRSCHSPAFNYSEAQAAESPDDFIHKLRVVLKELKECRTSLKVIKKKEYIKPISKLDGIYKETEELIAIIGKSISTAEKNRS